MAQPRSVTALLCPVCHAPDNVFTVEHQGATLLVDECCCMWGQRKPVAIEPKATVVCGNCLHQGKAASFAVKHARQPGEKFAKDEIEFLDEREKGLVSQPAVMNPRRKKK